MGVHEALPQPGALLLNGLLPNDTGNVTRVLDAERWSKVEERIAELIVCIQPNRPSEVCRNAVAKYVQELIVKCFSCEVFTFGSVPLKTYLPDGDIDLTAFSLSEDLKDTWANVVLKVLENEGKSGNGEFRVKEVHYIQAEVKIIKCLVENIVVDISFSQVGGLCTLCFLEEIDHLISQNHLFKRSIILIKAWCYYESRTLGAYHGLISTYALEILVLYIFNVFNNTFAGPFEVLYRFLEFFSNFDWDNFCVSIWGPVPISSLPVMTAELPRKDDGKLLFDKLFLEACSTVYAVSLGGQESQGQQFVSKYFNVIDPLRMNNNLGRSVNKGNFYRIRSAFAFGAKKIANLLDCPKENLIEEVDRFFMNTWERHRSGNRPDTPSYGIRCTQLLVNLPNEGPKNPSGFSSLKKNSGNIGLQVSHEHQAGGGHTSLGYASHVLNNSTKKAQRTYRKVNAVHANSKDATTLERNSTSSISTQCEMNQKNSRPDHSVNNNKGMRRSQFSRAQSSPELTGTYADALSQTKHNRFVETSTTHNEHVISERSSRKVIDSEAPSVRSARFSFDDPNSSRQSSSHQCLEVSTDSSIISNSYLNDSGSATMTAGLASENCSKTSHEDGENNALHNPDPGSTGSFETENEGLQIHFDERQHSTASRYNHVPTSRGNVSNASIMQGNLKVAAECREHRDDYPEAFPYQSGRTNVVSSTGRNANWRFVPTTQPSSFRRKSSLETSRVTKTTRDKWGRKPSLSEVAPSLSGKPRCGQQSEGDSEHASSWVDDESRDCSPPLSFADAYSEHHALEFVPLASPRVRNQPSRYEAAQISVADRSTSIDPVVVGSSRQKVVDDSGVPPSSFYPEGPLFPSLTRFPAYNFLADGANSDGSINRFDEDSGEQNCKSPCHQDMDIVHKYNQFEGHMNSVDLNATRAAAAESEVLETDILNSDFASHWQNLQYGRLCQNALNHGLFVYSPPVIGPPVYLQGHYPLDGSVRPTTANINFFTQIMGYDPWLVPVTSLQSSGPSRPSSANDRYKNERPSFRAGTGTYLPNPKSSFRDRNFSSKRNHRGSYNYGRSDKKDTEGRWINSKAQSGTPPARMGRADDQRPAHVNPERRTTHDQRHGANRGASALSSPEKPSSPHNKR